MEVCPIAEASRSAFAVAVARLSRNKSEMKITITDNGYISQSPQTPIPGKTYYLEDADAYTPPMRKLWESLVEIAYRSGQFSVDTIDKYRFRNWVKLTYGEGFYRLRYVSDQKEMIEVKSADDIPDNIVLDFEAGNKKRILGVLKSTTKYSKKQFRRMIDNTISAMIDRGIDTLEFRDILTEVKNEKGGN